MSTGNNGIRISNKDMIPHPIDWAYRCYLEHLEMSTPSGIDVVIAWSFYDNNKPFCSIGIANNAKNRKRFTQSPSLYLKAIEFAFRNMTLIENALNWHYHRYWRDGDESIFLSQCERDLENPFLTREGKENITSLIVRIKNDQQIRIFKKCLRSKFVTIRKKNIAHLLAEANYKCQNCGAEKELQVDHIIPYQHGGTNELNNLQILCRTCNIRKGGTIPEGYI